MEKIVSYKGFRYRLLNSKEAELIDATSAKGKVKIPETIIAGGKEYTVVSIGDENLPIVDITTISDKRLKKGYRIEGKKTEEYPFPPFRPRIPSTDFPGYYDFQESCRQYSGPISEIVLPCTIKKICRGALLNVKRGDKPGQYQPEKIILSEGIKEIPTCLCKMGVKELHIPSTVKNVPEFVACPVWTTRNVQDAARKERQWPPEILKKDFPPEKYKDDAAYRTKIIIHNDEGFVAVNPVNAPIKYVGKPGSSILSKIFKK